MVPLNRMRSGSGRVHEEKNCGFKYGFVIVNSSPLPVQNNCNRYHAIAILLISSPEARSEDTTCTVRGGSPVRLLAC
jgi:hypothetical protein